MLNRTQIRALANSSAYAKGLDIYHANKVLDYSAEQGDGVVEVDALVKGSGRKKYQVSFVYDVDEDDPNDFYCECPAFYSYDGICKHCVAVLLEYTAKAEIEQKSERFLALQEQSRAKLQGMKGMSGIQQRALQNRKPETTPAIKALLAKQRIRSALPVIQQDAYGKVKLEPYLVCSRNCDIKVSFKIGVSRMYVLQDIFKFTRMLRNQEEYEYGKNLKFVHEMDMFDGESRSLVIFLDNWTMQNSYQYQQYSPYSYAAPYGYTAANTRDIPLENGDLGLFLDAVGSRGFRADINGSGDQIWQVTGEPLPRTMRITGGDEGINLEINNLFGFQYATEYIYFDDGSIYRIPKMELTPIADFITAMAQIPERKVFIKTDDVPYFCREFLPELEKHFVCTRERFDEHDYELVPVVFHIYLDAPQKDIITCKPVAVYGEKEYEVYGNKAETELRDMVKEMEIGKIISAYCNAYDEKNRMMVAAEDEEKQYELLAHGIPRFQQLGEVYVSEALKKINITKMANVAVGVSLSGGLLELSMTAGDMTREQLLEILSRYDRKKKFYRLGNGDFIQMDGDDIAQLLELKDSLGLTDAQLKKANIALPKYRALYLDEELKTKKGVSASRDKGFKALIRNMKTVEDNDFAVPDSLSGILRDYQKRGFLWIKTLKHNGFGGILADDMGLGKTLQVIAFLESEFREAKPGENRLSLIVSPASLVFNWNSELQKFAPDLPVKMLVGSAAERQAMICGAGAGDILLTSYDLLKRDIGSYEGIRFFCQVIDEAQYIKNHNTQASKAVKTVNADFKLALTGTPVENRLSELWSIFDYLMPGFLYPYSRFKEELEQPIVQNQDVGAMTRLQKMIKPFVLRRLKKDVLRDLPDKLEKCVYAGLAGEQQKLYDAHVKRMKLMLEKQSDEEFKTSKIQILAELTKLRQICCNPALIFENYKSGSVKTDMCLDLIQNAISGGHKILLFSQFTSMLERLQDQMKEQKISFYTLTGAVNKEKRARLVEQFNQDDTSVFCISLKAGGTGLNLTSADIVIHYDPWWNLAVQNQATDRAHRIGQKNVVMVYKLIVKGTIEENIMKLQDKKRELADQILSGEGMGSGSFSKEELLELL